MSNESNNLTYQSLGRLYEIRSEGACYELMCQQDISLLFILRGEGTCLLNNNCHASRQNSVLVGLSGAILRCMPDNGVGLVIMCLQFAPTIINGLLPPDIYEKLPSILHLQENEAPLLKLMLRTIDDDIHNQYLYRQDNTRITICALLIKLCRIGSKSKSTPQPHPVLLKAMDLIDDRGNTPVKAKILSKELHISCSRLSHLFRNAHGVGIRQYLIQKKIAKAKCLLIGDDKIETIAAALGYQDKRAFLRQFKKDTMLTPTEYRRAFLNGGGSKMFDECH